jgi:hypothetical protein
MNDGDGDKKEVSLRVRKAQFIDIWALKPMVTLVTCT